ncbi:orotidine-5'-phosphate decarboxylase [Candidatus Gottesmanbacteria bacterium CG11_big_fil_rev_8_21_14_0_20_37_11]|uniref:Orotidine 5'-phosphate decarboxylase n=1 Tax=Candidatus Gottesmanbacteria bacterium CG11_big_fil_rev_8_21_14_0_20_37_11 TaxID=1974575 RepID=A0A2H0NJ09_9BACT|nr:MAG: orotidine-5'-phosphate decarboxylase [Candidatus Gottesmanbacteria bacterium CG11_big_fil_rev_8_21_14_0_20_37_11]
MSEISTENNSLLCIGLDSDINKLPFHIKGTDNPQYNFNKAIIEATYDLVCAYKPNSAFYEAQGEEGIRQLKQTVYFVKENYPKIPVILDAKRADIGNTNEGYVKFAFDHLGADAITLHPYLGKDALKPFLERRDKGLFILCRTSNSGAGEFQDLEIDGKPLYQVIAAKVAKDWNYNGNCGLVVGATYPKELDIVRHIVGNIPILIPGIGAQGGDLEKTVQAGVDKTGLNALINSSRGIIFASTGVNFAEKAREEALKLKNLINKQRRSK